MGARVPMACPLCPGVSLQVPAPGRAATRWGRAPLATANAAAATPAAAAHAGGGIRHPFSSAARHLMPRATRRRGHRSTRNVRPGRAGRCPHAVASHHFGQPGGRAQARARHAGRGGGVGPLRASPPTRMVPRGARRLACTRCRGCLRGCSPSPRRSRPAEGGESSPLRGRRRRQPWPRCAAKSATSSLRRAPRVTAAAARCPRCGRRPGGSPRRRPPQSQPD